jgi:hypothetical protein
MNEKGRVTEDSGINEKIVELIRKIARFMKKIVV